MHPSIIPTDIVIRTAGHPHLDFHAERAAEGKWLRTGEDRVVLMGHDHKHRARRFQLVGWTMDKFREAVGGNLAPKMLEADLDRPVIGLRCLPS